MSGLSWSSAAAPADVHDVSTSSTSHSSMSDSDVGVSVPRPSGSLTSEFSFKGDAHDIGVAMLFIVPYFILLRVQDRSSSKTDDNCLKS